MNNADADIIQLKARCFDAENRVAMLEQSHNILVEVATELGIIDQYNSSFNREIVLSKIGTIMMDSKELHRMKMEANRIVVPAPTKDDVVSDELPSIPSDVEPIEATEEYIPLRD